MSNYIESDEGRARLASQHADITVGSPLAVIGLFVEVIRARFVPPNDDTSYVWRDDPTPLASEENDQNAPRLLYIESGNVTDPEARDFKPAIYVDKEDTQLRQVVIGNRSDFDMRTRTERFYMQAVIPVTINCISDNRGESMIIGDLVWFHLLSVQNYVRATFGINNIAEPILGATRMFRRSGAAVDAWTTPISFAVTIEFHWITRPVAPLLKEVSARLSAYGAGDATAGAIEVAMRTTRTR